MGAEDRARMKKPPTFTVVYKKRPKIALVLETGQKVQITQCPTRYLTKSKQYTLPEKKK